MLYRQGDLVEFIPAKEFNDRRSSRGEQEHAIWICGGVGPFEVVSQNDSLLNIKTRPGEKQGWFTYRFRYAKIKDQPLDDLL